MQRTIRRLTLSVLAALALSALVAAPALATTVTTTAASKRKTTSVVLNGVINTGGEATAWEFQWGRTIHYNKATPLQQIPAGKGTVAVSWKLTHLQPDTTYHFRLVTTTGTGSPYFPLNVTFGRDLKFTTNATGRLLLGHNRLVITNKFLTVSFQCLSGLPCIGRVTISTRARLRKSRRFARVLCATHFYTIKKHGSKDVTIRVRGACLALLRKARHHRHLAKLSSNPRTGQHAVIKRVILVLG